MLIRQAPPEARQLDGLNRAFPRMPPPISKMIVRRSVPWHFHEPHVLHGAVSEKTLVPVLSAVPMERNHSPRSG